MFVDYLPNRSSISSMMTNLAQWKHWSEDTNTSPDRFINLALLPWSLMFFKSMIRAKSFLIIAFILLRFCSNSPWACIQLNIFFLHYYPFHLSLCCTLVFSAPLLCYDECTGDIYREDSVIKQDTQSVHYCCGWWRPQKPTDCLAVSLQNYDELHCYIRNWVMSLSIRQIQKSSWRRLWRRNFLHYDEFSGSAWS